MERGDGGSERYAMIVCVLSCPGRRGVKRGVESGRGWAYRVPG